MTTKLEREAMRRALEAAAARFEGTLPFNWVCADGYANGFSIAGELRLMAYELTTTEQQESGT